MDNLKTTGCAKQLAVRLCPWVSVEKTNHTRTMRLVPRQHSNKRILWPYHKEYSHVNQDYLKEIRSYNASIITVGYATFFGLLLYLKDKVDSSLLHWSGLSITLSACIFVFFEIINQIRKAIELWKIGGKEKLFLRYWFCFFIPSLIFTTIGVGLLLYLFVINL
jgi:hypothetical protein